MARSEWEKQHLANEMAKPWWRKYAIRHTPFDHYIHVDWYKYRKARDRTLMSAEERRRFTKRILKTDACEVPADELRTDKVEFETFLDRELLRAGPSIPEYPVLDWLAKSIFRWYWPALWTVNLDAPDWLSQIRDADTQRSFSFAECEAYARRARVEIGPVERLFLRVVTREGVWRDLRRPRHYARSPHPPLVLEGFHNPSLILSAELRRSLSMSKAEVKARRRLTRDELASSDLRHRPGRRKFTPSGAIKRQFLEAEK